MIDLSTSIHQLGSIYFWKYKTDGWIGGEWHFHTDTAGRNFFIELIDRMTVSSDPCRYLISIKPVTQKILQIPDFNSPFENRAGLRLQFNPHNANFDDWFVSDNEEIVEIAFGKTILNRWRSSVLKRKTHNGELSIGLNDDHTVFVW